MKIKKIENFFSKIRDFNNRLEPLEKRATRFWALLILETFLIFTISQLIGRYWLINTPYQKIWNYASYVYATLFFLGQWLYKYLKK